MPLFIDQLDLPQGLHALSTAELERVATEVRSYIIETITQIGGHLGASLGAVELAVALHAVFESPRDRLVWDVGHQCYPHKVLTGRKAQLALIRQYQGISGFLRRDESPHDHFGAGHASTALSAAMGMAMARDLQRENYKVVAIVGDGSLTGGMALEALNNTKHMKRNFIVVLNDNEMSISPNVGALSEYFTRIRTNPSYVQLKDRLERLIFRIPRIGTPFAQRAEILKDRLKRLVIDFKAEVIFEELGFTYLGPINGHNIPILMSSLQYAKDVEGPVLLHLSTVKGKGYAPAEEDPVKYHGISAKAAKKPEKITPSGGPAPQPSTYTSIFAKTLETLAATDPRVVAITAAMREGTGLVAYQKQFPDRFFDVGIAEQHAVTFAAGLATAGMKPVCAIYSTFLQRAFDQIIHDVCLQNLDVTFAIDRAGLVGEDGATHHGVFDIAYLRTIPNMVLMAPKDENELRHMLKTAVDYPGPAAVRYPRGKGLGVSCEMPLTAYPIGKGEWVKQTPGTPYLLILALGTMVQPACEVALALDGEGFATRVINARFAKPLDETLILQAVQEASLVVTVEEGVMAGGFGSAVLELFAREGLAEKRVFCMGLPDQFIEHGAQTQLCKDVGLTSQTIHHRIREWLKTWTPSALSTLLPKF